MNFKKYIVSSAIFVFVVSVLHASELPAPFKVPETPYPSASAGCATCTRTLSASSDTEKPFIISEGALALNVSLAKSEFINLNGLLTVNIGHQLAYRPADYFTILVPGDEKGDRNHLIAREGSRRIIFETKSGDMADVSMVSANTPGTILKRDENNLVVSNLKTKHDYIYETKDSGRTWRIASVSRSDNPAITVSCEYANGTNELKSITIPGNLRYELSYNKDGSVSKVTGPDGEVTEFAWDSVGTIKSLRTSIPATHPLHPDYANAARAKFAKPVVTREIITECDSAGRIVSLTGTNGERYTAEYRSDASAKANTKTDTVIVTDPSGIKTFNENIRDQKADTLTIVEGNIYPALDDKGAPVRVETQKRFLKRVKSTLVVHSTIIDGKEKLYKYNNKSSAACDEIVSEDGKITRYEFTDHGLFSAKINPDGTRETWSYDENDRLVSNVTADGLETKYEYDSLGRLAATVKPTGEIERVTYNQNGLPEEVASSSGTSEKFEWDSKLRMTKRTLENGVAMNWTYKGSLSIPFSKTVIPASGDNSQAYTVWYSFDKIARLTAITYPDNTSESWKYNCCNIVEARDRAGAVTKYAYDDLNRKVSETSPNAQRVYFAYDRIGRLVKTSYPDRTFEFVSYDGVSKRIAKKTFRDDTSVAYEYDSKHNRTKETWSDGRFASYSYDSEGRQTGVSGTKYNTRKYVYNAQGRLVSELDFGLPKADSPRKTAYEYDKFGRMVKVIGTDGSVRESFYSVDGKLDYTLERGIVTKYSYDKYGRIVFTSRIPVAEFTAASAQKKDALSEKYKADFRTYDAFGNLFEIRENSGRLLARYSYAPGGELQSVIRPVSENSAVKDTYVYTFTGGGVRESAVYSKNIEWMPTSVSSHYYNESSSLYQIAAKGDIAKPETLGRLISRSASKSDRILWTEDALGNKTSYNYEPISGLLLSVARNGEIVASYQYDGYSRVKETTDILGRTTQNVLDRNGRMTASVLPDGSKSEFVYDEFGRMHAKQGAGSYPLSYNYNSFGELVSYTDGNGSTTKFEYDSAGRVTKRIWADGSTVTYTYDSLGRLASKSEAGRNTSFSYDSFGRLIGEKIVFGKDEYSRKMSYDELGRLASVSDASGIVTFEYDKFGRKIAEKGVVGEFRMSYDSKGRLASMEARLKGNSESFTTEYAYDEFDRIVKVKSPSGEFNYTWTQDGKLVSQSIGNSKVVNSYDKIGRLISKMLGDTVLASYEYDSLDRRIGGQYFDVKWRYSYDQFNQLTGAKSSTGDKFKYEYDAIGNRLKVESNGKMEAYAYNNLNQISSAGYAYDQWGNMVMTPDAQYAYDLKNRLVKVTKKDGTVIDYAYDAMDQRISSTVNGGKKTEFLMSNMVEYARNDGTAMYHTLGLDLTLSLGETGAVGAVLASGNMSYLYDGNGNVIGVMQDGKITHKLAYEPFGKQTTNVNLPFTFSTKSVDQSDMSYYGFRFYNHTIAKWEKRDLILEKGGYNYYAFIGNNLFTKVDFAGLLPKCPAGSKTRTRGWIFKVTEYRTLVQAVAATSNGCGPSGFDWLVPDKWFLAACNTHDICYGTCGSKKSTCDNEFWNGMTAACNAITVVADRNKCLSWRNDYYGGVASSGNSSFESGQDKACKWEACCP